MATLDTVIIGAGQAGLGTSQELTRLGIEHVVLERGKIGQTWRGRWDSFCLVTPNWACLLPSGEYSGSDPDGYMPRDEIVAYLEGYAASSQAPVRSGVEVTELRGDGDGAFLLETSDGPMSARTVVVSTGAYQRPFRPAAAATLPAGIPQLNVEGYRNPGALPEGPVLVIGSGQSGCQVAEELREAGRDVVLSCGRTPWAPRRIGGRDLVWWLIESGFLDQPRSSLPSPAARLVATAVATGHGGGRDLHLRTLHALGVRLVGRFLGADGPRAVFAQDLAESVAFGDERYREIAALVGKLAAERGLGKVDLPSLAPVPTDSPEQLDITGFGAVMFCGGFRPDYTSWARFPQAFDEMGFPITNDGASEAVPGLYFSGVHFMRKRKSSLLCGVGEDATIVAQKIATRPPLL